MAKDANKTDSVRASRDGHEFHEAWVARKAMQLLLPTGGLAGMAIEGLSPSDQKGYSSETVQVADLTLYYGDYPAFADASRVEIVQFKYSVSHANIDFRMSHAKKTVEKFVEAYGDLKNTHGAKEVQDKLYFRLITNRPVFPPFIEAITGLAEKRKLTGDAKELAKQFKKASLLDGERLAEFAGKCVVAGLAGNLGNIKKDLSKNLVDWSATPDAIASARLGDMRQMVRDKAGSKGEGENVITRMDVLAALDIAEEEDLLPCPSRLPEVEKIVEREQLTTALALIPGLSKPLLVNAAGGMGKTVFMQSLAEQLKDGHEVVFFDCFAGGAYRSPEDSRHLPEKGLVHIANELACRGLCDPILPGSQDLQSLLRTFRRRLEQSVGTLAKASHERKLLLLLDAIDNAEVGAEDRGEDCFPTLLLKSFRHDPPDGVKVIASSRSHRIPIGSAMYEDFELSAFSYKETKEYVRTSLPDANDVEIRVAQARSKGNPRILEHLVDSDGTLLDPSESNKEIELDELIRTRIKNALSKAALNQGYKQDDMDSFLAGLAVLPPPVPLEEYARSQGVEKSAAESFATDMRRWLERTEQGLMFRDEPTETLIREEYGSSEKSLKRIVDNLKKHQNRSVYATRALPELLYRLGDGHRLFNLAFDETFPEAVTGTVGKRNIRYARLKAALRYAAEQRNYGQLVGLLVEMSTVAGADQLGAEYILDYPDLVMAAKDVDAVRRLFETRPPWPGTRHARLAIANALHGDLNEAVRHAEKTEEWIDYWYSQPKKERRDWLRRKRLEHLDIAAIPFIRVAEGDLQNAARFVRRGKDRYSYRVWEHVFDFSRQANLLKPWAGLEDQLAGNIGGLTAALSFIETDKAGLGKLMVKLSKACNGESKTEFNEGDGLRKKRRYNFAEGLCKACGIALSLGLGQEASAVLNLIPKDRPGMGFYDIGHYLSRDASLFHVSLFLVRAALTAAVEGKEVNEKDVIPKELMPFCEGMNDGLEGAEFRNEFIKRVAEPVNRGDGRPSSGHETSAYERKREAEHFMNGRMGPLMSLTKALSRLLSSPEGKADEPFMEILVSWADAVKTSEPYGMEEPSLFFHILGCRISTFSLWARSDLNDVSVRAYIERLHEREPVEASTAIKVVEILAKRQAMQILAGEEAVRVCSLIERENDVRDRADFYAGLARAILPASEKEAAEYFRKGLEEMDAVGEERDYGFINGMLLFAFSLEGKELDEKEFHRLTNICELNVTEEPEEFPWISFGQALSRVAGYRGLAKLSRWEDRLVPMSCTLLPYLTALIGDGKIDPEDALALNRLARPEEFIHCGSGTLAAAIESRHRDDKKELVSETIAQFMKNQHGIPAYDAAKELADVAGKVFGKQSETAVYLERAHSLLEQGRKILIRNDLLGPRSEQNKHLSDEHVETRRRKEGEILEIAEETDATDMRSIDNAVNCLQQVANRHDLYEKFFDGIREKVPYGKKEDYVRMLASHETLNFHKKLDELERYKNYLEGSSASLANAYREMGVPILLRHRDELVYGGRFSTGFLRKISELSCIPMYELALEFVKKLTAEEARVTREVWLGLSSVICEKARKNEARTALSRLLNGPATKLSPNASDGEWKEGLYPKDENDIFSGMVWRMLGSPVTEDRWRAAHSVRCFARFKRWRVLDALVDKIKTDLKDAGAFQASERPFYFMHAKLWLLIALARVALDAPKAVAKYKKILLKIAFDEENPHVLMAHFATEAIWACVKAGEVELQDDEEKYLRRTNKSPFPRLEQKTMNEDDFYDRRPKSFPEPKSGFSLDGHFYEYDVKALGKIFGKAGWKVKDAMSEIVQSVDPETESMYNSENESGEWVSPAFGAMTHVPFHTYGQHLGWHALFMAAGRFLKKHPVTNDCGRHDDPWNRWLRSFLLTGSDGLWPSDGMDQAPLNALATLLEEDDTGLVLTGDKSRILKLVNLESGIREKAVVAGEWDSADQVRVHVESALVKPAKVRGVVEQLFQEDQEFAWLPNYGADNEDDGEYRGSEKDDCEPWVVWPGTEQKLDQDDPLGSVVAVRRLRIARSFSSALSPKREHPFGRVWKNEKENILVRSSAWGPEVDKRNYEKPRMGRSLACSRELLKDLLSENDSDLIILIKLQQHKNVYGEPNVYMNKTAVVRIKQTLEVEKITQDAE